MPGIKGTAIESLVVDVNRLVQEGRLRPEELEARLQPEDLEILGQKVLAALWYPLGTYERLTQLMLKVEGRMELAVLRKHGASIRELARVTGHSRNTVRRHLRGGEMSARRKPTAKRAEKLDDFKDYIVGRMAAASPARIPAAVLFREIRSLGIWAARHG